MKRYFVMKETDNAEVIIIKNKSDHTFLFVNLTKQHICPCRFESVEEVVKDMIRLKAEGKIRDFIEIKTVFNQGE